ncbi:WGR domain-containing protein (plasmid) [Aquicoccus sp. G2-2]|uniref:WGR domain-containing protein n=1 Tax=Aquicoccus sp. G2-2 TaxID=3092120 RepID=UPI002ADF6BE7|nr:WGR domain-containing protein [Aquicoccus sp. G2-2]MEA1111991.1 WGR domain-containing protein [Aquicoccus sp. G2-2]
MQQLEMFPEDIRIERVDHDTNMFRFYRLRLMPDLFGGVSLLREWGRIGTQGRHRIDCFEDAGARLTPWPRYIGQNRNGAISSPHKMQCQGPCPLACRFFRQQPFEPRAAKEEKEPNVSRPSSSNVPWSAARPFRRRAANRFL